MEMDKSEIAVSFRLARDKKAQIETLADLNLCSPYEIAKVLDEMGALQGSRLRLDMFSGKKKTIARWRVIPLMRSSGPLEWWREDGRTRRSMRNGRWSCGARARATKR